MGGEGVEKEKQSRGRGGVRGGLDQEMREFFSTDSEGSGDD